LTEIDSEDDEKHDEKVLKLEIDEKAMAQSNVRQFWCIPLSINVLKFDFNKLAKAQKKFGGRLFDIITMDPPWLFCSATPTRGVAINYDTINDDSLLNLPIKKLQKNGFLFIWVINCKYRLALEIFKKNGYKIVDEIVWAKQTINGKIGRSHGYYL
jgi:mRNA (2'-O-methyladenosine-N6-)-methyltransferase